MSGRKWRSDCLIAYTYGTNCCDCGFLHWMSWSSPLTTGLSKKHRSDVWVPQISQFCLSPRIYQYTYSIFSTFPNEKWEERSHESSHAPDVDIDSYDCAALREALRVVSPKMLSAARARLKLEKDVENHGFFGKWSRNVGFLWVFH